VRCYNKETPNDYLYFVCGGFDDDGDPYEKNGYAVVNSKIVIGNFNIGYVGEEYAFEIISKEQFQKELSDLGFEYNFEDDTISELKWKPKDGDDVFILGLHKGELRPINVLFSKYYTSHIIALNENRIFKTENECEEAITKIKNILK